MKDRYFTPDEVLFGDDVPIPKRVPDTSGWGIVRPDTLPELDLAAGVWEPCAGMREHIRHWWRCNDAAAVQVAHRIRAAILSMEIYNSEVAA